MKAPLPPPDETRRLEVLWEYEVLDTPPEEAFDELATLAAHICEAPIALISLVDQSRQWFKSRVGLSASETPRDVSFCGHAIGQAGLFIVPDAARDERFADNPLVTGEPCIRFYAGAPLISPAGPALGALCVIDRVPRELSPRQQEALGVLSRQVVRQLESRRRARELTRAREERDRFRGTETALRATSAMLEAVFEASPLGITVLNAAGQVQAWNRGAEAMFGWSAAEVLGRPVPFVSADQQAQHRELRERMMRGESFPGIELRRQRKDGTRIDISLATAPLRDRGGGVYGILGVISDITERKRAEVVQASLYEISEAAQQTKDLDELYRAIHRIVGRLMPADNFYIALYDPRTDVLSFPYAVDEHSRFEGISRRCGAGLSEYVLRRGEPLSAPPAVFEGLVARGEIVSIGPRCVDWLGTPLKIGNRTVGVMAVQSYKEGVHFGEREKDLLQFVSTQVAVAIERKRAEAALHESEEHHRLIFERSPLPMWVYDRETLRFLAVNQAAQAQYGYSEEEFLGMSIRDIRPAEEVPALEQVAASLPRGLSHTGEWRHRRKDGAIIRVAIHSHGLQYGGREARLVLAEDITERKRTEEALTESENQLRVVWESALDGMRLTDAGGTVHRVNEAYCRLVGKPREVLEGQPMSAPYAAANQAAALEKHRQRFRARSIPAQLETAVTLWNGRTLDLELSNAFLSLPGQPELVLSVFRDVTERKEAETALRASEESFRAFYENATIGIYRTTPAGRILMVNPAAVRMLGYETAEEVVQRNLEEGGFEPSYPRSEFRQKLESAGVITGLESAWIRKDGTTIFVRESARAIKDQRGKTLYYDGTFEDITDRKLAEERVLRERDFGDAALNSLPGIFYVFDQNGRFVRWNKNLETVSGYSAEELGSMGPLDLVVESERALIRQRIQEVFETGAARAEAELVSKRGQRIPYYFTGQRFEIDGQLCLIGTGIDRSERKRAEEATRKSEASLALAQRVAHLGSWEVDLEQDTLAWSEETFRIFGLCPGTFAPTNEGFFSLVHPEDRDRVRAASRESIATGQPYSIDHRIHLPDGSERVVSEHADIFLDARGKPVRMVGTVQDVTHVRQIERALQHSERHFRSLIENAQDMITILDFEGRVRFQSPSSQRVTGHPPEELVNQNLFEFVHPEDAPAVRAALERALREPDDASTVELRLRHADGSWRTVESIGKRLSGEEPPVVVVNSRDVTERRRLEEQFRQSQKMQAIGQLAGGVAHDFNNILTVIQCNAALLSEVEGLAGEDVALAKQILEASERAAGLTRQLLLFSRKQVMQATHLFLNEVVANMTKLLQRILGEDVALHAEFAPNLPAIHADAGMMEQVLLNLAVNARDAMPGGGRLQISTSVQTLGAGAVKRNAEAAAAQWVCLSVSDSGSGIAAEHLPHIFEPFFTTKEVGKGTGLGLATVYGIVEQHHGWIEVASEVNRGTTFSIYFPACAGPAAEQAGVSGPLELPRGHEVILVVEDEPPLRLLVTSLLQRCGYTVLSAASGVSALEVWRTDKDRIDLLLTDLIMPEGLNGRQLAERLKGDRPDLKVLYTSGYSADVLGKEPVVDEDLNFLQKPYEPITLARAVRDFLDRE